MYWKNVAGFRCYITIVLPFVALSTFIKKKRSFIGFVHILHHPMTEISVEINILPSVLWFRIFEVRKPQKDSIIYQNIGIHLEASSTYLYLYVTGVDSCLCG